MKRLIFNNSTASLGDIELGGIYAIRNTSNGRVYIGQTHCFRRRWAMHLSALKRGDHCNPRMQADWVQFGHQAFEFSILEFMPKDDLGVWLNGAEKKHIAAFVGELYNEPATGKAVRKLRVGTNP